MAWTYLTKATPTNGKAFGWVEIVCDTEDDIAKLPTRTDRIAVGSVARVIDGNVTYVLNNNRVWSLMNGGSGSGGGLPKATADDAHKILTVDENGNYELIDAQYGYDLSPVHVESRTGSALSFRTEAVGLTAGESYTFIYTIEGIQGDIILTGTADETKDGIIWSVEDGGYTFTVFSGGSTNPKSQKFSVVVTETGIDITSPWTFDYAPEGVHKIPARYLDVAGGGGTEVMRAKLVYANGHLFADGITSLDIINAVKEGKQVEIHYYSQKGPNGGIDMILFPEYYNWEFSNGGDYVVNSCTFHGKITSGYNNSTRSVEHREVTIESDGTTYIAYYNETKTVSGMNSNQYDGDSATPTA